MKKDKSKGTNYTFFEPNQILSASDLNDNFDYLDEQSRLTRASLIGTGIVCGLEIGVTVPSSDQPEFAKVTVKKGHGITSCGYLISSPEILFTSYQEYQLPDDIDYLPLSTDKNQQYDLFELIKDDKEEQADNKKEPLTTTFIQNKALLLFLEFNKSTSEICTANADQGSNVDVNVRYLLIDKATKICQVNTAFPPDNDPISESNTILAPIPLPRPSINEQNILKGFREISYEQLIEHIQEQLNEAKHILRPLLIDQNESDISELLNSIKKDIEKLGADDSLILYYYDFFDDLLKAYEEFRQKAIKLLQCLDLACPSVEEFQRHLMLGALVPASNEKLNRHYFKPSPATTNDTAICIKELRKLFNRLVKMIEYFNPKQTISGLRLTLSKLGDVPLSDKAIPCYYDTSINEIWRYDKIKKVYEEPKFQNNLEKYNFIRIDGHLVEKYTANIKDKIEKNITDCNLPVKVIALYEHNFDETSQKNILNNKFDIQCSEEKGARFLRQSFSSFLKRHPGIQHKAGVPLGGTFIIIYEIPNHSNKKDSIKAGQVIADFFLPYHYCSDCVQPLALNITFNCENGFTVTIEKGEGTPPFFFQLNKEDFQPVKVGASGSREVIINPSEGVHTLIVCDSEGMESTKHVLHVPKPLITGKETYKYDLKKNNYTVKFEISGGKMPYTAEYKINSVSSSVKISDYTYTSASIPSGKKLEVTIKDANNCSTESRTFHRNVFPCEGKSLRCGYRFWLPANYQTCQIKIQSFSFDRKIIGIDEDHTLNNDDSFDQLAEAWFKKLTDMVAEKIGPDKLLLLNYSPPDNSVKSGGTFEIEYFECLQFKFCIQVSYDDKKHIVKVCYSHNGTEVTVDDDTVINIPPFDCTQIDKSYPTPTPTPPVCSPDPDLQLSIFSEWKGNTTWTLEAFATGKDQLGATYLWEVQDGTPALSNKKKEVFHVEITPGETKKVLLTAYTEKGCKVTKEHELYVPLTIGEPSYKDISGTHYKVSVDISGGSQPYYYYTSPNQKKEINGSTYTSELIETGTAHGKLTIEDNQGNKKVIEQFKNYTVRKLPCKGKSKRCAYRLWLQKPTGGEEITEYTPTEEIQFVFNEEKISLPNSKYLLQLSIEKLTEENFDNAVSSAVERLNTVINHALSDAGFGDNRLLIQYQPDEKNDPFSILWIEYFDCDDETFSIEFDFTIESSGFTMRYAKDKKNNGSVLTITTGSADEKPSMPVPAFDCSEENQYNIDDYKKNCSGSAVIHDHEVTHNGDGAFICKGKVSDPNGALLTDATWIWDFPNVQLGQPFYIGNPAEVEIQNPEGPIKITAITKKGCVGTAIINNFPSTNTP